MFCLESESMTLYLIFPLLGWELKGESNRVFTTGPDYDMEWHTASH